MEYRNASAAVIGAGDFIGAAIAKKFASEGFTVFAGRRKGEKLAPLVARDRSGRRADRRPLATRCSQGGRDSDVPPGRRWQGCTARGLHLQRRCQCQFPVAGNHGAGVPQGLGDGLLRRILTGREAARLMLPRDRGNIFFTVGLTAGLRGGVGYAAFASAKIRLARSGAECGARTRSERTSTSPI